jgi:hypothetical protein
MAACPKGFFPEEHRDNVANAASVRAEGKRFLGY